MTELDNKLGTAQVGAISKAQKYQKDFQNVKVLVNWGPFYWKIFLKKSHNAEKTERGDPLGFFNIHSVGKYQKIEGGPFGEFFSRKQSLTEPKIL